MESCQKGDGRQEANCENGDKRRQKGDRRQEVREGRKEMVDEKQEMEVGDG